MYHIVADVISKEFSKHGGKFQVRAKVPKALMVSFSQRLDYSKEEGCRQIDVVLYAPFKYVQVWTRKRWTVIGRPNLMDYGGGDRHAPYIAPGKDYTVGVSEWVYLGDHDSGWYGVLAEFLRQNLSEILGLEKAHLDDWYTLVDVRTLGLPEKKS